jgi:hypothetical protein
MKGDSERTNYDMAQNKAIYRKLAAPFTIDFEERQECHVAPLSGLFCVFPLYI